MGDSRQYRAFLSYSHRDEKIAKRLHHALENYRPPNTVKTSRDKSLGPVFRDQDEMEAASDLSDRIKTALEQSDYLIVLASPHAKRSNWVNTEIRYFRELKGDAKILCALIHPNPQASFPEALTESGKEPLAADLSPKNFRMGLTQIAAAMLGVGLDDLIRRDIRKLRRRVMAITASAITAILVMGSLTWTAMSARDLAEQRRQDAEGQIEFMLTDLKDSLESVGRLDALDAVAKRAIDYYNDYPIESHDDDAIGRRAKVFHMLGSVQEQQGNYEQAARHFESAYESTDYQLRESPDNPERIFEHSQSAFYVGDSYFKASNYSKSETYLALYGKLIEKLAGVEGPTKRVQQERNYVLGSLSSVYARTGQTQRHVETLEKVVALKTKTFEADTTDLEVRFSLINSYLSLVNLHFDSGDMEAAMSVSSKTLSLLEEAAPDTVDFRIEREKFVTHRSRAIILMHLGRLSEAKSELALARQASSTLASIDTSHSYVNYQEVQTDITDFHIAYIEGNLEEAQKLHAELLSKSEKAEVLGLTDRQQKTLVRAIERFPLYLAIGERDVAEIERQARKLKAENQQAAFELRSSGKPSREFFPYLLSLRALSETVETSTLDAFCNNEKLQMSYRDQSAFATLLPDESCPAANLEQPHPVTILRKAINNLEAFSSGETP